MEEQETTTLSGLLKSYRFWKILCAVLTIFIILAVVIPILYLRARFGSDNPVVYGQIKEHFKYGSTGGDRNWGFPYWIWRVAPEVCADLLPHKRPEDVGYESLGMLYEEGNDLPVGVAKRHHLGIDRVFLNCAACHTSTYRKTPESPRELVLGMPANLFNLMAFQKFFFQCGKHPRFNWKYLVPAMQRQGADLDFIDRYLVYPVAIWVMRDLLQLLETRFAFTEMQPPWGPGRVDTFNAAKAKFNFPWDQLPKEELVGTTDFPSIWNQRQRKQRDDGQPMSLHWDGNNDKVEERNLSAAFGTGAIPPVTDHDAIGRIEDWLLGLKPPAYPFPIERNLAAKGALIYKQYCADCHGANGTDFSGKQVGKITPIEEIGTDRWRLDSYTYELAVNQGTLYAGYPQYRFKHFRKTFGYANAPLDGIWLRAPYLHNGSVPTLRDLLEPADLRPKVFYRGNDLYDSKKVGFVADSAEEKGWQYFRFDTALPGNSNKGHEGPKYGTELSDEQKGALLEYLKTF